MGIGGPQALPRGTFKVAALAPIVATLATWAWSFVTNRIHPNWYATACLGGDPPPFWAAHAPIVFPVSLVVVGLFVSRGVWRQGQGEGYLVAILWLYYLCALAFLAVSSYVMFTPGFC